MLSLLKRLDSCVWLYNHKLSFHPKVCNSDNTIKTIFDQVSRVQNKVITKFPLSQFDPTDCANYLCTRIHERMNNIVWMKDFSALCNFELELYSLYESVSTNETDIKNCALSLLNEIFNFTNYIPKETLI